MVVTSLDKIVRNILQKRRYPLVYYIDFLVYAKDILRELGFDGEIDTLRYCVLPVDANNEVEIPNDYVDYCRVSAWIDQYMHPLVEDNGLVLMPNYDSSFAIQPYTDGIAVSNSTNQYQSFNGYLSPYWWMTNWDIFGENLGRQFGGKGTYADTFRINKARNKIKINEFLSCNFILLEYVGDGLDADSATQIDVMAQMCIESGALWQYQLHNRSYSNADREIAKGEYLDQRAILRARKSNLTIDALKRIVQSNSVGIKY